MAGFLAYEDQKTETGNLHARSSVLWSPMREAQIIWHRFKKIATVFRIAGFHCHAIKIKIENHSLNEVKKLTRYRP